MVMKQLLTRVTLIFGPQDAVDKLNNLIKPNNSVSYCSTCTCIKKTKTTLSTHLTGLYRILLTLSPPLRIGPLPLLFVTTLMLPLKLHCQQKLLTGQGLIRGGEGGG